MKEVLNKFLLAEVKSMAEMNLRQTRFTYWACEPFTKSREKIQKFKEVGDSRYIYQIKLVKDCF